MFDSFILKYLIAAQALTGSFVHPEWKDQSAARAYLMASWLTEPLCKAHQFYQEISIVDALHPEESWLQRTVRKGGLFLTSSVHMVLALGTTLPGIEMRLLANSWQSQPYIHFRGKGEEKPLNPNTFTLLSWNLCCLTGGYSITNGGVLPWAFRKEQIIQSLRDQEADLICLSEIFDIQTALYFFEGLQDLYSHFYFHIGPSAVGLSSGLFVASKSPVKEPHFIPFPKEALHGKSKLCKKGLFSFDVPFENGEFAQIFSTHFQHSEMADYPLLEELEARQKEMELILTYMKASDHFCILTGDLNLDEREFSPWREFLDRGVILGDGSSWGGDQFCATLVGKNPSNPANLDHTLIRKGGKAALTTTFIETGFDSHSFKKEALSDHRGLFSTISLELTACRE